MNINYELYRVFYTVANTGNITKAAKELMISQPAISKSIKTLEGQLNGSLFVRTKRGVILTEEGKVFYKYISQAIDFINNAENEFTSLINLEKGTIRIGVSTTLTTQFLLPYLKEFNKVYPNITIQLHTNLTNVLISKYRQGLIDLVILNLPYAVPKDFEIVTCRAIQDCFVVSEKYDHLVNKELTLGDLNNYPLILQSKESNTRKFLDDFCFKNDVTLKATMTLASYTLVTEFTEMGLGIGYVTKDYIKKDLRNKKLFELKVNPAPPKRHIGLIYAKQNSLSFGAKELIKIITK